MYKKSEDEPEQWNSILSKKDFEFVTKVKDAHLPKYTSSKFGRLALIYLCKTLQTRGIERVLSDLADDHD